MNSFSSIKRPSVKQLEAIGVSISLLLACQPLAATTAQASFRSQIAQRTTSPGSNAQADKVKELALKLTEAKTEDERDALLAQDKALVTVELVRALSGQGRRSGQAFRESSEL